eukprot:jgi/Mesen1/5627/ME000282S04775
MARTPLLCRRWLHLRLSFALLLLCTYFSCQTLAHGDGGADDDPAGADGEAEAAPDLRSSRLMRSKGGAIAVFFLVPFIGCWIPYFLRISPALLKYGLLCAAGLFFTIALEHLTGDSASGFADLTTSSYPFTYLLVVGGYMMAMLADVTVHSVWARQALRKQSTATAAAGSPQAEEPVAASKLQCCQVRPQDDVEARAGGGVCSGSGCGCNGDMCRCNAPPAMEPLGGALEQTPEQVAKLAPADMVLLFCALCFHAVFEGLAIGLSTTVYDTWNTTLTIVLHKFFEGLALGSSLVGHSRRHKAYMHFLYAAAFSITAPVGIAIGIILDKSVEPRGAQWVEAIGNGFAAGVFIYVAISHIVVKAFKPSERDRWFTPFIKWACFALGVLINSLLELRES